MKKIYSIIVNNLSWIYKVLLGFCTVFIILTMFPKGGAFKYEFQKGSFWKHKDIYAPFDFAILKSEKEIEDEKKELKKEQTFYFFEDTSVVAKQHSQLLSLIEKSHFQKRKKEFIEQKSFAVFDKLFAKGIIENYEELNQNNDIILLGKNNIGQKCSFNDFFTIETSQRFIDSSLHSLSAEDKGFISNLLKEVLAQNILFDKTKTKLEYQTRLSNFSNTLGMIAEGQLIIAKGEPITSEKYQILISLKSEYDNAYANRHSYQNVLLGGFLLISISLIALFLFLKLIKHPILNDNKKVTFVLLIIVMMVGVTALILKINPDYLFLSPLCLAPIIIRVFFDTRVALYIYLVTIIITGFLVPNSFEFIFYQLIAGMMSIISVEHLEKRSKFFEVSLVLLFTYSFIYFAMTLIQDGNLDNIEFSRFVIFGGNALLTLLAFPLIYIFEKMFGFVSDISLMELSNTSNKALRDLANKAPGTFQHAIQVANIAEDVIHEIGGNALLARVGGLYHDIGKLGDPMFFIENQNTGLNPHNDISFVESASIIRNHVFYGIELAYKYKLPEIVIDFIRTHHGTGKTRYFYLKQKSTYPDFPIDDTLFSYPGPRPYSKETAVVMMVDSVEAASKSLAVHSEEAISNLIDNIINTLTKEEQFSNSDITLRDIDRIKIILKSKMMSIYHVRIEYPVS